MSDIAAVVQCYRPQQEIEASRADAGFNPRRQPVPRAWEIMDGLRAEGWPCFRVWTNRLIAGDFAALRPAFDALGLALDEATANAWIEPSLWRHGAPA